MVKKYHCRDRVHGTNSSYKLPSKLETWFIMKLYNLAFIKIICNLEDYILEHCQYTARGRLGEILCLIPTLQAISCELVDTIQFSKILGYAEVDALINEMLLNRGNNKKTPGAVSGVVSGVVPGVLPGVGAM